MLFALLALTLLFAVFAIQWLQHRPPRSTRDIIGRHAPAEPVRHTRPPAVRTDPVPEPPADEEVTPESWSAAHTALAEALGYVAIRCYVGTEMDADDYVGSRFGRKVENGWFSDVVRTLEGTAVVERSFASTLPGRIVGDLVLDRDFEAVFQVSWKAEAFGTTVPCTVAWPTYADLTVQVVDQHGEPVPEVRVAIGGQGLAQNELCSTERAPGSPGQGG
ncbi:MAG: hypothetical protein ACI8PZ_006960 [Myxococcota bacterium]